MKKKTKYFDINKKYLSTLKIGDEVYLFDVDEVVVVDDFYYHENGLTIETADGQMVIVNYNASPKVLYGDECGVLDIHHLPVRNELSSNNRLNEVVEMDGFIINETFKWQMFHNEINEQYQHAITVIKDSFKELSDNDVTNNYYLCQCNNCQWFGSSILLVGGGFNGIDYNDGECPICRSTDINDK